MSSRTLLGIALMLCLAIPLAARAEVVESSPNSLSIRQVVSVDAPPAKAWQSFLQIARWWSKDHSWSGDASNFHLDAQAGGCFCETLANGGSVRHMSIVYVAPEQRMILTGGLGPFIGAGVSGALTFQITPRGTASQISMVYNIGGFFPGGLTAVGPGVDGVIGEQTSRLKRLIETGSAEEKKPAN